MPDANYLDPEEDGDSQILPPAQAIQQQQNDAEFENDVADPNRPPMRTAMVQTPSGPLPVQIPAGDPELNVPYQNAPALGVGGPSPVVPPQPDPTAVEQKIAQAPTLTAPKWWQRLGSAALGAGAGWSNAASRTRQPIDISAASQNILHPGYQEKKAEFESQLSPIMQGYQLEAGRNIQANKNLAIQTKAQLENAQAQQNLDRGAYWLHRAQQDPNRYKIGAKGEVVDQLTGAVQYAPQTKEEEVAARIKAGMSPHDAQMSVYNPTHFGVEQRPVVVPQGGAVLGPDGKPTFTNPKTFKEPDPLADEMRTERLESERANQNTRIDTTKQQNEQRLQQQRAREITQAQNSGIPDNQLGAKLSEINKRYANELQGVQNNYESAIRGRGGNAEHFEVKVTPDGSDITYVPTKAGIPAPVPIATAQPPQPQPPQPQPPQPTPQKPQYLKFATNGKQRLGFNPATKQWEPVQQ